LSAPFVLLLATVQLLLPAMATWADAELERKASAQAAPEVHAEAPTFGGHTHLHPADCVLCHVLSSACARPAHPSASLCEVLLAAVAPLALSARSSGTDVAWGSQPRAPPALA
jgi:hypothetical protein